MTTIFSENFNTNTGSPLFSTNGTFNGSGFAPVPASGQLDSDFWRIAGFSDNSGLLDYGATVTTTGDYARGVLSGDPTTAGVYAVNTGVTALGASSFVIQPTAAEFGTSPGTITLRVQYTGATALTGFTFDYDGVFRNNAGRETNVNFSWAVQSAATQPATFSSTVAALSYTTPVALDALGWQRNDFTAQTFTTTVNTNDYIFLRWTIGDGPGGSGSRDEVGFDNLVLSESTTPPTPTISIAPTSISQNEGNSGTTAFSHTITRSDTSADTSVQVTITGGAGFNATDIASVTVGGSPVAGFTLGVPFSVSLTGAATTATVVVNVAGDTTAESNETFTVALASPTGGYTLGTSSATDTVVNDDIVVPTPTHQIAEIQGSTHLSPLVTANNTASTTVVTIEGIVTARSTNGFYIQDDTPDSNILTSDAVFIFTNTAPDAGITVGERVNVTGKVYEFQNFNNLPLTQIVAQTSTGATATAVPLADIVQFNNSVALPSIRIGGTGGLTPALASTNSDDFNGGLANAFNLDVNGRPIDGTDFWETVEGMRVVYSDPVVADGFWYSFNGFYVYSETIGATLPNSRGGLTMNGGTTYDPAVGVPGGGNTVMDGDQNPERIQIDFSNTAISTGGFGTLRTEVDMGDKLNDITGIVRMDFTNWKLFATDLPTFKTGGNQATGPAPEVTTLAADSRELKIAAYNVENLTPGDDTNVDEFSATGIGKFNNIGKMVNERLGAPDVLLISEVQDNNGTTNDGTTSASVTWTRLTQALRTETGKDYVWVDREPVNNAEGGAGGTNIRVGFIYDKSKVQLGGGDFVEPNWVGFSTAGELAAAAAANDTAAAARRVWTDRIGDGTRAADAQISISDNMTGEPINTADWAATRLSLLGEFSFNGQKLFLTANHWPSKGGSGAPYFYNPADLTADGLNGRWEQRKNIAQDMWSVTEYGRVNLPDAKFVFGGDLNEYWFFDPVRVLEGRIDQTGATRAPGQATMLSMNNTEPPAERFGYTFDGNSQTLDHIVVGSNLVGVTEYDAVHVNTGYNSQRTQPAGRTFDISDHDPSVIVSDFRSFSETLKGNAGGLIDGFGGDDTVTYRDVTGPVAANLAVGISAIGGLIVDSFNSVENLVGSGQNDILTGSDSNNVLSGLAGEDTLFAGAGNDTLNGGEGDDDLRAGAGTDRLNGGAGNDRLVSGGPGATSIMDGGDGNDFYDVQSETDTTNDTGTGIDVVWTSATHTIGAGIENFILYGVGAINGTGNGLANFIRGNDEANQLSGLGGDDDIRGGGGNDTLNGGEGGDTLYGEAGNDTLNGDNGDDDLRAGTGTDTLNGGAGNDRLVSVGPGNSAIMDGGDGRDLYLVSSATDTVSDSGIDTSQDLVYSDATVTLGDGIEDAFLFGTAAINLTGNNGNNALFGNGAANVISGMGGDDIVRGGDGNDTITGGIGGDSLYGEDGNDTVSGGDGFDLVSGGAGNDVLDPGGGTYDQIIGGAGADTFRFRDNVDANLDAFQGVIRQIDDFNRTDGDRIDMSGNGGTFAIVGSHMVGNAFEMTLNYIAGANVTIADIYLDGDATADLTLRVYHDGAFGALQASDFLLG